MGWMDVLMRWRNALCVLSLGLVFFALIAGAAQWGLGEMISQHERAHYMACLELGGNGTYQAGSYEVGGLRAAGHSDCSGLPDTLTARTKGLVDGINEAVGYPSFMLVLCIAISTALACACVLVCTWVVLGRLEELKKGE